MKQDFAWSQARALLAAPEPGSTLGTHAPRDAMRRSGTPRNPADPWQHPPVDYFRTPRTTSDFPAAAVPEVL
jgi:hypothetical protein